MAIGGARVLGVVLAGGRSTRWGSEKAVAVVNAAPMVARVAAVLSRACDEVAVNAPDDSGAAAWARAAGLRVLPDAADAPDGPLAGVLAGLDAAADRGDAWLLTTPCDTPWLPEDLGARLLAAAGDAPAATAVTSEGTHPLCTLWSVRLRAPLADALAGGAHPSVRAWLQEVGATPAHFAEPRAFKNLNTPPPAPPSPARIVAAVTAGVFVSFAAGLAATLAMAFAAPVLFPCGDQPLCGGDESPRFLVGALLIPALALATGAGAGWRVAVGHRRRRR